MTVEGGRERRTDRRDLVLAALVASGLLALYFAVQRGRVPSYDGKIAYATARAISNGRLHLLPEDDFYRANLPYSHYGIGMPLVILPLYLLQRALGSTPDLVVTLACPLLLAATGAVVCLCARELGWSRRVALAGALAATLLTQAVEVSQELFSEPGISLSTALLVLGILRWRNGRSSGPWLAGIGVGSGLLFRSDSAVLLGSGLLLLPAFVPWRRLLAEPRAWIGLALPILAAAAWTAWYAELRDGSLVPAVYGGTFTTPWFHGLYGLLLSHGKSLFVYNPFLLLAIPGALVMWRRDRATTALLLVLAVARPLFYARWSAWYGGVAWGPRFLMPTAVPLSLLAMYGISRMGRLHLAVRVPAALVVAALVVASGLVGALSVLVPYGSSWTSATRASPELHLKGVALRKLVDRQLHAYFYSFGGNSIAYNLKRVTGPNYQVTSLTHFRGGAEPSGIIALIVAAAAMLIAWMLGHGQGRGPPPPPDERSELEISRAAPSSEPVPGHTDFV